MTGLLRQRHLRVFGLLLALSCCPVPAAKLPDWAQQIADGAPTVEGLSAEAARILLVETRLVVLEDGEVETRRRLAVQALRSDTGEVGLGFFPFDEDARVLRSRAWHQPPEGKARKSRNSSVIDVSLTDSFLSDQFVRMIDMPDVEKGSLVFFEFEVADRPEQLVYQEYFYEGSPVDLARFEVEVPEGWQVRNGWLRQPGPDPVIEGNRWSWELRGLRSPEPEPLGPAPYETAPLLVVSFLPPSDGPAGSASFVDWTALAAWYQELLGERDAVTPAIEQARDDLLGEARTDASDEFFARVERIGRYVRDHVRYVAKEIGIGGYRPHHANDVLRNLYGDCKDKGTLFRAMLAAAGYDSYPILINASIPDTVSGELPSLLAFNHFIVAVPLPAGVDPPARYAPAVVDASGLGSLLIVDTTDAYTAIGSLPASLEGQTGLVVAGNASTLVTLPSDERGAHIIERQLEAELRPDLSLGIRLETARHGAPAAEARWAYGQSVKDFRELAEKQLEQVWPELEVEDYVVEAETADGGFVERLTMTVPPPASGTRGEFPIFPGALDEFPRVSLGGRDSAIRYPYPMTFSYGSSVRGLPAETVSPGERDQSGTGWSVSAHFTREGDTLSGVYRFTLSRLQFDPGAFDELKDIWSAARRAAAVSLPR